MSRHLHLVDDDPNDEGHNTEGQVNDADSYHVGHVGDGDDHVDRLVDGEVLTGPAGPGRVDQREVIPSWLRSRSARGSAVGWFVRWTGFVVAFHTVRVPLYGWRLATRAPVGLGRIVAWVGKWVADVESFESRQALVHSVSVESRGADALFRMRERHRSTVHGRLAFALISLAALAVVCLWALVVTNWWQLTLTSAAVVAVLGVVGRSADQPLTDRATSSSQAPRLTSELIVGALASLGLGKMTSALARDERGDAIRFVAPITRSGPGWRADLDLPPGITATEIIERRAALASGLRRPLGCVWPEVDPFAHEGRLILYVADRSLADAKPTPWPLERAGKTNVFEPIPIGVDQRGEPITITLMFASGLIGAIPRMGKTFLLRLLTLGAVLDHRTEAHIYNLKGGPDLDALTAVAHAHRVGDDPDDIAYALTDLRGLVEDMRRRYKTVRALPKDVAPESKVTDAIASKRSAGLHPILLAVDECQIWFEHPDHGKEFIALATDLVKRGPAVGIMAWFATQRPDAKSIPPGVSDNAVLRFCLKVNSQVANDMVLGTSMYKAGYRATTFGRKDLGIAWYSGDATDPIIVRTAYIDALTAEAITTRARAAKAATGWLSGLAAGQDPEPDQDNSSVLDHLAAIWPTGHDKVWCETLATRLADTYPTTYQDWTGEQVTAAVKPHGISTVQVKRDGTNRRGLTWAHLAQALADRDHHPEDRDDRDGDGDGEGGGGPPFRDRPTG